MTCAIYTFSLAAPNLFQLPHDQPQVRQKSNQKAVPVKKLAHSSRSVADRSIQRYGIRVSSPSASTHSTPKSSRPPSDISPTPPPLSPITTTGLELADLSLSAEISTPLEETSVPSLSQKKLLEEVRATLAGPGGKATASMVVIGHVDAGKSTIMGRLTYELGHMEERQRINNERASEKMGKGSFAWAWGFDALTEERERGVTMDITQVTLQLPALHLTILDAPGHKDFVPNLISGASQADTALLVVDAGMGEFESGFQGGGQTREHILLVRSLGVSGLIVAVNKLDMVDWSETRFHEICNALRVFLVQSGFQLSRVSFIPCAAMKGVNLTSNDLPELKSWYDGPTLAQELDKIVPPSRDLESPVRIPISNVFRGGTGTLSSGVGVSGRLCTGVIQTGDKFRVLPGDEVATIRKIEINEESVPWASAGSNVTLYLAGIELLNVGVGSVLCPLSDLVPLATSFNAQIIIFDLSLPLTSGATVELFHHSRDTPATIIKLLATIDRASGAVLKTKPRVLTKNTAARVEIQIRASSSFAAKPSSIPLETFSANKDMGRILLRRGGETIAAGIVTEITS